MPSEPSLSKRIKRHVIGRTRPYFAATAPGHETICHGELADLGLAITDTCVVVGGVEFNARLQDCYLANLHLRTANRVLMRVHQFEATGFRPFEKAVAAIPWELYLPAITSPKILVTTKHCRLYHSAAVGERVLNSISKHATNNASERENQTSISIEQKIFVRGADDRFTVSIDSSGEHLHKRGLKKHSGRAPLRETIAAAALLLAGYRGSEPVIDPMCGSGTFSLEAALIAQNIPPGWYRQFAFMQWPSFRPSQWEYLKREAENHFTRTQAPLIFASDKDPAACRRLEKNVADSRLADIIQVSNRDFFEFRPQDLTDQTGLVAINPPYGKRLENRPQSERLFMEICSRLKQAYIGWKVILISPNKKLAKKVPLKLEVHPISHGGLKPVLMVGSIS
jgi:putative N6-adenine-specific DNA methylase